MITPISIIGTVIIAPIAEEIIFRGILFNFIRKRTGNVIFAIIISSVTFGIAHGNGDQGIYAALLGIFLALIYLYTGSIFGDILVHMIANGTTVFQTVLIENLKGSAYDKFNVDIVWIHVFIGIAACLFAWYFYKKQTTGKIKKGFFKSAVVLCTIGIVCIVCTGFIPNKTNTKATHKSVTVYQEKKS
ncbi:MAG: lysostaphin resistance A-like protein [Clostridium sp.]